MSKQFGLMVLGCAVVVALALTPGCKKDTSAKDTSAKVTPKDLATPMATDQGKPDSPAAPVEVFFNGNDLDGWEGRSGLWTVKDGAIAGSGTGATGKFPTYLVSKRAYTDFELKFQVKLLGTNSKSGVQFRSKLEDPNDFVVSGPQCFIGPKQGGKLVTQTAAPAKKGGKGDTKSMFDSKLAAKVIKPDDFNDYEIRCVGTHLTIMLNDTAMHDAKVTLPEKGHIAFQIPAAKTEVIFRNIRFKDLSQR